MKNPAFARAVAGIVLSLPAAALAQAPRPAAPTPPPAPMAPAPVVVPAETSANVVSMSAFEVKTDEDRGYVATNSLAGGRTNTPLRLTPSSISAMTRAFLDDLQITNIRDAFAWTVNVAPGNLRQNETPFGDYEFNFRGTGSTGNYPTRNYFLYYGVGDAYNTERFEFARGPNSILFGDAQLGGVATTFTKVPQFARDRGEMMLQYDTFSGKRATLDLNQVVNKNLAVRVNGLFDRPRGWHDNAESSHDAVDLAVLYKLGDNTQVRVEGEMGNVQRKIYSSNYFDQASFWDGTTSYDGTNAIADNASKGVNTFSGSTYNVLAPGLPQAGYSDWSKFYRTNGTGVALMTQPREGVTRSPALPKKEFNLGPPDSDAIIKYHSLTGWLDHQFSERLQGQISAYTFKDDREAQNTELFNTYQVDVNRVLPNGAPNPKYGVAFAETTPSHQKQKRTVDEVRAALTYNFTTDWLGLKQRFSVIGGMRSEEFSLQTYGLRQVSGPGQGATINAPENQVHLRLYWDEPLRYRVGTLPTVAGYTFGYAPVGYFYEEKKDLDYAQIASNTTLWDDRVSLVLGMRNDHVERTQRNPIYSSGPTLLGPANKDSASAVTSSAGAVVYPVKWLGGFFNYSENFAPVSAGPNKIDGSSFGPTRGRGIDYGVKFTLKEGMIYATASRYESKQTNRITSDPKIGLVRGIWTNFGSTNPALTTIDFRDTEAIEATGYEFEVTANPTRSLRISAGLALPETKTVDLLPGLKQYAAQHRAEWQAALTNGTATNAVALGNDLNNLDQALANAAAGTVLDNTLKHTANIYATYSFVEGPLHGWSVGAGAWQRGRQKIGSVDPRILFNTDSPTDAQRRTAAFNYLYAPEYYNVNAHIAYERKFGNTRAKFQLNVSNLLDDEDPIFYSNNVYREGGIATNPLVQRGGFYNLPDPRKFTFTATFEF